MKSILGFTVIIWVFIHCISCKEDPTGPETNCHLNDLYIQDYHGVDKSKVFDLRFIPPKEIKNDIIEYGLSLQLINRKRENPTPYPYSEYFIDSIAFLNSSEVEIHIFENDDSAIFTYTRNDCGLDLQSSGNYLHFELTHGGDELTEQRFAIYDHQTKGVTIDSQYFKVDTFSFIEFRLGAFSSYEDIIKQFAIEHPGQYDTVAVELVQNKTME